MTTSQAVHDQTALVLSGHRFDHDRCSCDFTYQAQTSAGRWAEHESHQADELQTVALLRTEMPDTRPVDPPDCGCTECLTGEYRTAVNWADYYAHHPDQEMPDWAREADAASA